MEQSNPIYDISWWASLIGVMLGVASILGWFIKVVIFDRWEAKQSVTEVKRLKTDEAVSDIKSVTQTTSSDVQKILLSVERTNATLTEHNHRLESQEERIQRLENKILWGGGKP